MTTSTNPELDRVATIYDDIAPTWDQRQGLVERRFMGQAMRVALANALQGEVLDVGVGTGPTLRLAAGNRNITSFTGIDLSEGMLEQARRASPQPAVPVTLRTMNAEQLDFPDATFDTVTTSLTLCTVPDPARALSEMARVCREDGRIVLLEHVRAPNRVIAWLQRKLTPLQVRMLGCHFDRPTDKLVRDLGFQVEREATRFFGIFRLIVAHPPERPPSS
jgi:ubiquinone/menaquinone biosynthesis C-methylase UbiE